MERHDFPIVIVSSATHVNQPAIMVDKEVTARGSRTRYTGTHVELNSVTSFQAYSFCSLYQSITDNQPLSYYFIAFILHSVFVPFSLLASSLLFYILVGPIQYYLLC